MREMEIKEARALVTSFKKDDPRYKKAVEMCIEDDKNPIKTEIKGVETQ